jgi:hypothetical protein
VETVSKSAVRRSSAVADAPDRRSGSSRGSNLDPRRDAPPVGELPVQKVRHAHDYIDPRVWERKDMRLALAHRDVGAVYRLLQRFGVSQRAIAARTGQSQSEVSEIIAGRRVVSYYVLERIALGLGIPRGWMGLGYTDDVTVGVLSGGWS